MYFFVNNFSDFTIKKLESAELVVTQWNKIEESIGSILLLTRTSWLIWTIGKIEVIISFQ